MPRLVREPAPDQNGDRKPSPGEALPAWQVRGTASGLRVLFLDMNAYFASVEQQLRPELRGRPVAVASVEAETTACVSVSYEAKPFGVRTGTMVAEARRLCPSLVIVPARPAEYVRIHHRIVEAVESCLPVSAVHSIDEMSCRLMGEEKLPQNAARIAARIKSAIRRGVGDQLRCSIGVAPNRLLAKVAADLQKPDGLTILGMEDLPGALHGLALRDLPGIGSRMEARLASLGVTTVAGLCAASETVLRAAWRGRVGSMWWQWLRGDDLGDTPTHRRTLSHEHVLPPGQRDEEAARAVGLRLVHKVAARLRRMGRRAGRLTLSIKPVAAPGRTVDPEDTVPFISGGDMPGADRPGGGTGRSRMPGTGRTGAQLTGGSRRGVGGYKGWSDGPVGWERAVVESGGPGGGRGRHAGDDGGPGGESRRAPVPTWHAAVRLGACRDTLAMATAFLELWAGRPRGPVLRLGVTLDELDDPGGGELPLFAADAARERLADAMDRINTRHGRDVIHLAAMQEARDAAPLRIAFGSIPDLAEADADDDHDVGDGPGADGPPGARGRDVRRRPAVQGHQGRGGRADCGDRRDPNSVGGAGTWSGAAARGPYGEGRWNGGASAVETLPSEARPRLSAAGRVANLPVAAGPGRLPVGVG